MFTAWQLKRHLGFKLQSVKENHPAFMLALMNSQCAQQGQTSLSL
jgi:hypothetical protein